MVAFPDLETEPRLLSVSGLLDQSLELYNENLADRKREPMSRRERIDRINNNELFTVDEILAYDVEQFSRNPVNTKSSNLPNLGIKGDGIDSEKGADPFNAPDDIYADKNRPTPPSPGGDSISSGRSVVTVTTVTNSDPYPDFPSGSPEPDMIEKKIAKVEKWYTTTLQISVPFFIAGIGTIGAGLMLSNVQEWPVFVEVSELFILVPALLGLKGNLDMCLASRLSTQANLGNMTSVREIMKMVIGNVVLVQIQAMVAAVLVSIFAVSAAAIMHGGFAWNNVMLLATSSVCTATSSCFVLDFVLIGVIMISRRCKMNPDNLATPLAASIGDLVSITILALIASSLFELLNHQIWILYLILAGYLCMLPVWICIVLKNKYTRSVLKTGWTPVLSALFISGLGGLVLDQAVDVFNGFVIFQPIINGVGGNLVSIQASRMSTLLHQTSLLGILPPHSKMFVSPWTALVKGVPYAKTARILITMSVPGQLLFIFAADYIQWGYSTLHVYFVLAYLTVGVLQVILLLYVAHIIIHAMWRFKIDPDNSAIPYLTSLGDLSGSVLLAAAFWLLQSIGHEYGDYN